MPRIKYEDLTFKDATLAVIAQANAILAEYEVAGFDLTLRQLYYQFVSRDLIPNKQSEYDRLGGIISKARRAGLIDWNVIVDRGRYLRSTPTWTSPESIMEVVADQFKYDAWLEQPVYVEIWYEKEALAGVFGRSAARWRLPHFACRGYPSDSEVWRAAQRFRAIARTSGRDVLVLHFGDHDPSGIDMTRDLGDRFRLFGANGVDVRRLALNMDQVEEYEPPPNPAKEADSRYQDYLANYGDESWELDALPPTVLDGIVTDEVKSVLDTEAWNEEMARELKAKAELTTLSRNYARAVAPFRGEVERRVEELERQRSEGTLLDDDTVEE